MWPLMLLSGLKNVGAFLLTYWKEIIICLMVGTIAYQNLSHKRFVLWADTIPYLVDQNKILTNDLKVTVAANKNLTSSIQGLNTVVGDWIVKSKELQAQNDALQGKLNDMQAANNKKVQTILAAPTPKTCEDSLKFLRDNQKALTWSAQK
jgi:hypothetical protein